MAPRPSRTGCLVRRDDRPLKPCEKSSPVDQGSGQQTTVSRGGLFVDPLNVAFLADGRLVVSDIAAFGGGGGLIAVDPTNGQQSKIAASIVFRLPSGMAVDPTGQVVVAYPERVQGPGAVLRVNRANGDHTAVAPGVTFISPVGVALDANGNVLVTDPDIQGFQSRLHRIDQGVGRILATGKPPGHGLAIEPRARSWLSTIPMVVSGTCSALTQRPER